MNLKKFLIILVIVAAAAIFSHTLFGAFFRSPKEEISLPDDIVASSFGTPSAEADNSPAKVVSTSKISNPLKKIPAAAPVVYFGRLSIPKIKVDAKIQKVGISQKGNMAVPTNFSDVGWYKYGTIPGQTGSAVIAGHVGNRLGFPAVFAHLEDLAIGDDIYIENEGGVKQRFVVSGIASYDFDAPADKIFSDNSGKFLRLITCTGTWNDEFETHNERLVVTATLAE